MSFERVPFPALTDKVASSLTTPVSLTPTAVSLTPVTVIANCAVSVSPLEWSRTV